METFPPRQANVGTAFTRRPIMRHPNRKAINWAVVLAVAMMAGIGWQWLHSSHAMDKQFTDLRVPDVDSEPIKMGRQESEETQRLIERSLANEAAIRKHFRIAMMGSVLSGAILLTAFLLLKRELRERIRVARALTDERDRLALAAETSTHQAAELATLYNTAPVGLFHFDQDLKYVRVNDAMAALNGLPAADHLGRTLAELLPPELAAATEPMLRRVMLTGEPLRDFEVHGAAAPRSAEQRDWLVSYHPVKGADGVICGVQGAVQDVTARKRAEELAHHHEQFKAAVLDAFPAEIAVLDGLGSIVAVNERWLRFGQEDACSDREGTGVGVNYLDVTRASMRDGDALAGEVVVGLEAVLKREKKEFHLEYPCDSPTESRWYLIHAVAAPEEVGGAIVAHTDISQRKYTELALRESEERLRSHIESSPLAVVEWDKDFNVTRWAGTAERMFGWTAAETVGRSVAELRLIHEEDLHLVERVWVQLTDGVTRQASCTNRNLMKDGRVIHCTWHNSVLYDCHGRMNSVFSLVQDITEQVVAEEEIRRFNEELGERVVERTLELQVTVRELENEISERQRLEREILEVSEREQNRLGQDLHDDLGQQLVGIGILSEILSSRLRAESHPCAADAGQLRTYLSESIGTVRNLAKMFYPVELERGGLILALQDLALRTEKLAKVSCTVIGDEGRAVEKSAEIHLYRIAQEAVSNALKHGSPDQIAIHYRVSNDVRTLTITDDGSGFCSLKSGTGTGMGLPILQYRARMIGAKITVERGTPAGCIVTCSLPVSAS